MILYPCPSCGRENRIPAKKLDARARCGNCKTPFLPLDRPYDVTDPGTFEEIVRDSPLPVIVDFWAQWCPPCHAVAPELKKLALKHSATLVVAKVDTERLKSIAARFSIRVLPTLILFDHGREIKRVTGAHSADQLEDALGLDRSPSSRIQSA